MSWRVARSLDVLLDEIGKMAPKRSRVSDGSIGDAAHASRDSDHNPWVRLNGIGIVRARDFTHDPANGCDAGKIAEAVRKLGADNAHPALGAGAYVIWNRSIASHSQRWVWRSYDGSNPHETHCHVSVTTAPAGFDSVRPWGIHSEEIDVQLSDKLPGGRTVGDALVAVLKMQEQLARFRAATVARDRMLRKRLNELVKQTRIEHAELEALLDEWLTDRDDDESPNAPSSSHII